MGLPKLTPIILERSPERAASAAEQSGPWQLLGALGIALSLVGLADLVVAWFPQAFGNPEWEFGTVSATFDGLPAPAMGLVLVLSAAYVRRSRTLIRALAIVSIVLAILLVGAALLYATAVPLALRSIQDPLLRVGLFKALLKTGIQAAVYPVLFLWLGARAWRAVPPPLALKD